MAIHFLIPLAYRNIENLLFCEKEGIDQFPLFEKEGTGQFPSSGKRGNWSIPIIWKKRELRMLLFHFSPYYNVIGVAMARRYWIIPSSSLGEKNLNSPLAASPLVGNSFFSPRDSEGIIQYLLAIATPLSHCIRLKNKTLISIWVHIS